MAALVETKPQPVALGRLFCLGGESVGKLVPACSDREPGAVQEQYKSGPFSSLSHPLFSPPSPWEEGESEAPSLPPPRFPLGFLSVYLPFVLHGVMGLPIMREGRAEKVWHGERLMLG